MEWNYIYRWYSGLRIIYIIIMIIILIIEQVGVGTTKTTDSARHRPINNNALK